MSTNRIAAWIEHRTSLVLAVFSIGYIALMFHFAPRRPMWIDEYLTFYLARLPLSDVWNVLLTGAESHPPTFLYLTHWSMKLFGSGHFALRLPAILGFVLMEISIFRFVSRRTSQIVALTVLLVPFTTRATTYGMEARGYGLLLGLTGLALVCWQKSADERRNGIAVVGLAATLVAATACHYFGALIVGPLALGELVRTLEIKRFDRRIWAAFLAPTIPLLLFAPLIRASRGYSQRHGLLNLEFHYYSFVFRDGHALLLVFLLAVCAWSLIAKVANVPPASRRERGFEAHEVAALAGFLLLPVITYVLTRVLRLPFADRYVLSGVIAVSVLTAVALEALPGRDTVAALVLAGLVAWAAGSYVSHVKAREGQPEERFLLAHGAAGLPMVIADIDSFFRVVHTAPEQLARRLVYLTDPELAFHYLGNNTSDRILADLRPWLPMHIAPYCVYVSQAPSFYVYGSLDANTDWLLLALADDMSSAELVGVNAGRVLLLVHPAVPSRLCHVSGPTISPSP